MQVEIVDAIEERHIYSDKAEDGSILELIPGRISHAFILKMPDGRKVAAEVSEAVFEQYKTLT